MTATLTFLKLDGTTSSKLQLNAAAGGVQLKNLSGNLAARNAADSADATITGSEFLASGDTGLVINSDAASTGADWKISIARPTSGMTADWTLTLPASAGSPNQVLQTNGSGLTTWVDAASGATDVTDTTNLSFGDSAVVSMFTLPAGAVILSINVIVDTAFDSTPSMSIGVSGNASKYVGSGDVDLLIAASWTVMPSLPADVSSEALIISYSAASATVGSARCLVSYCIPS